MPIFNTSGAVDINGLTEDLTPDGAADFAIVYDDSSGQNVKVLLDNLPGGGGSGGAITTSDREFIPSVTSGDGSTTGKTISSTPDGDVRLFLNGVAEIIGNGVKTKAAYFSSDGGTTAKLISAVAGGDTLYWNGTTVGYELSASDVGALLYET